LLRQSAAVLETAGHALDGFLGIHNLFLVRGKRFFVLRYRFLMIFDIILCNPHFITDGCKGILQIVIFLRQE